MTSFATRSRFWRRSSLGLLGALSALALTTRAQAQLDISPPLPNVLLLVDTSGSMEFKTDGSVVTCNPGNVNLTNEKSRWINVVEVMTGTVNDYSCQAIDRIEDAFKQGEYQIVTGTAPYDWRYPIPYHRPLSGGVTGCAPGAGTLPGTTPSSNPFIYPAGAVDYHRYSDTSFDCSMSQRGDGILDAFGARVRFGLMTFDTEVNASRGYAPAAGDYTSANADHPGGQAGLWSYIVGAAATGKPMGCATPNEPQEVGARNGAAPAFEGRMINFGNPHDSDSVTRQTKTSHVKEVLLATRPFGATPIAGMLRDAEDFFWNDASNDPASVAAGATNPYDDYGPRVDPYLGCAEPREQLIILLTDGEPNMDLRPFCSDAPSGGLPAGSCPFDLPETTANRLANPVSGSRSVIKTYVVGFALEQVDHDSSAATAPVSCNSLVTPSPPNPPLPQPDPPALPVAPRVLSSACTAPPASNVALQACCNLWKIAIAGRGDAFFASNPAELRSSISDILSRHVATTSRTLPVTSGGGVAGGGSYRFSSGFEVGQLAPWKGHLARERIVCQPNPPGPKVPTPQPFAVNMADDFAHNVNMAGNARRFYTAVGRTSAGVVRPGGETVRSNIGATDPDGAGTVGPAVHTGQAVAFASAVPSEAMAIPVASYPAGITTANAARTFFLEWLVGANPTTSRYHRCRNAPSDCGLFGDIYHSTPQVVGAPSALLRDESYETFAIQNQTRPIVLYTSTNDGFLHAFKVTSNDPADAGNAVAKVEAPTNNELWAFAPPAVLPNLHGLYPYNHQNLLDGVPVIRDVVAIIPATPTDPPTVFERNATDARGGSGTWRSVLVQGFGADYGGYFALDVTKPVPDAGNPADTDRGGPRFLWQVTREANGGKALFGRGGGTPHIATLFFDPAGGTNAREIPVAILPGGRGGTVVPGACPATPRTFSGVTLDSRFTPRGQVKCYDFPGGAEVGALSLTIVRLDTGEIIRTFRRSADDVDSATLKTRVTVTDLDSPITGQPVSFPGQPGTVADRIIVGDQDGRLWKVNVASANPANWRMNLFFDLYPASILSTSTHDFDDGQPIAVAPVLSVDDQGKMTVNAATGDQDFLASSTGQTNYVYSFTEDTNATRTTATHRVNWLKAFEDGERVVGPLALFGGNLFFATFVSNSGSNICAVGDSEVFGMDYITPVSTSDPQQGGAPELDPDLDPATDLVQSELRPNEFISGVSVNQRPSCYTADPDLSGDDLVGFQGLMRISQVNPGGFELTFHTNQTAGGAGQQVRTNTIPLQIPVSDTRIASWASIIE